MGRETLLEAAKQLRKQAEEIEDLKAEIRGLRKKEEAEKVAHQMVEKGLLPADKVKEQAEVWINDDKDLSVVEESIKIAEAIPTRTFSGVGDSMSTEMAGSPDESIVNFIMGGN